MAGLVIRRRKKYLNPKYQINVLKHHFIIFFTLFAVYVMCFINIVLVLQQLWSPASTTSVPDQSLSQVLSIVSWLTLLIQITVQTYLLRLQGKKLVDMSHIFALLVTANLSLWIVDVGNELSATSHLTHHHTIGTHAFNFSTAAHRILAMFVTLNRYYCALIFAHFWRMRI